MRKIDLAGRRTPAELLLGDPFLTTPSPIPFSDRPYNKWSVGCSSTAPYRSNSFIARTPQYSTIPPCSQFCSVPAAVRLVLWRRIPRT